MTEIWKIIIINDKDTVYEISSTGRVKNKHTNHELAQNINNRGLMVCNLFVDNKKSTQYVHKLIAEYFVPNPGNMDKAYHIDGNKLNNVVGNIGWTTQSDVVAKGHATKKHFKRINQYHDPEKTELKRTFESVLEAAAALDINRKTVSSILTGKANSKRFFLGYATS